MQTCELIFRGEDFDEKTGTKGLIAEVMSGADAYRDDYAWRDSIVAQVFSDLAEKGHLPEGRKNEFFQIVYPTLRGTPLLVETWRWAPFLPYDPVLRSVPLRDGRTLHCYGRCSGPDTVYLEVGCVENQT